MIKQKQLLMDIRRIKKYTWVLSIAWFSMIIISLIWNIAADDQHLKEIAKTEARANFNKDVAIRNWAAIGEAGH